jgi:L-2-hydroxyglutarate oxidase
VRERALFSPATASVDPGRVTRSLAADAEAAGVRIRTGERFRDAEGGVVVTDRGKWSAGYVLNAGGVHADRIARRFGVGAGYRIMPFKGRYLRARAPTGIRTHLYPVPDLRYPFLGVHFTVGVTGEVWLGPTATPVLGREQYRWRDLDPGEVVGGLRSLAALLLSPGNRGLRRLAAKELRRHSRRALLAEARGLARGLPGARHWAPVRPGIRAQLVNTREWKLEDDFVYEADGRSCHVLNAVSPAFTCALPLAEHLLDIIEGKRTE